MSYMHPQLLDVEPHWTDYSEQQDGVVLTSIYSACLAKKYMDPSWSTS